MADKAGAIPNRPAMPRLFALGALVLGLAVPASAQHAPVTPAQPGAFSRYGLTVSVGTTGPALAVTTNLAPWLNVRASGGYVPYSHRQELDVDGERLALAGDASTVQAGAVLDAHPFKNGFRISTGVFYARRAVEATMTPAEAIVVGDRSFEPEEIGTLRTQVQLGSALAPYAGIGWSNALRGRVGFHFELGAYYHGSPRIDMDGQGMIAPTAENAPVLEANLDHAELSFYPEVSLGITFRLN